MIDKNRPPSDPLSQRVAIVDDMGRPTGYFLRQWNKQLQQNRTAQEVAGQFPVQASDVTFQPVGGVSAENVQSAIAELDDEKYDKTGGVITGPVEVVGAGGVFFILSSEAAGARGIAAGSGPSGWRADRYDNSNGGPFNDFNKARGSLLSPANIAPNDRVGQFAFRGYGDGAFRHAGILFFQVIESAPSASAMGGRFSIQVTPVGSTAPMNVLLLDPQIGIRLFSGAEANTVIDANRHHQLRAYTVATLPAASTAGQLIYVSDESGGPSPAFSDGTNWRRTSDNAIVS